MSLELPWLNGFHSLQVTQPDAALHGSSEKGLVKLQLLGAPGQTAHSWSMVATTCPAHPVVVFFLAQKRLVIDGG